jgi:hypothetical protein
MEQLSLLSVNFCQLCQLVFGTVKSSHEAINAGEEPGVHTETRPGSAMILMVSTGCICPAGKLIFGIFSPDDTLRKEGRKLLHCKRRHSIVEIFTAIWDLRPSYGCVKIRQDSPSKK